MIIKKMKTILEVEGKMDPDSWPVNSDPHYQIPSPTLERTMLWKREESSAHKRFRPAAPKPTATCPPLPQAPSKPKNDVPDSQPPPSVPVCKTTPWPGTGKMSGNLFEDRNWLLSPNYLGNGNENKT